MRILIRNQLELLSISSNKLSTLPKNVGKLCRLRYLYANGNKITDIPDELTSLRSLEELNVANNKLESLPDSYYSQFGEYDSASGQLINGLKKDMKVTVVGNPFTKKALSKE